MSRVLGNPHARFLGEGVAEMLLPYPTNCHVLNVIRDAVFKKNGILRGKRMICKSCPAYFYPDNVVFAEAP